MFAFLVLNLVFHLLSQEIGWEERLRNDLFYIEWDVIKPCLNQFRCVEPWLRMLAMRVQFVFLGQTADVFEMW